MIQKQAVKQPVFALFLPCVLLVFQLYLHAHIRVLYISCVCLVSDPSVCRVMVMMRVMTVTACTAIVHLKCKSTHWPPHLYPMATKRRRCKVKLEKPIVSAADLQQAKDILKDAAEAKRMRSSMTHWLEQNGTYETWYGWEAGKKK